jgi:hypothetical protein
VVALTTLCPNIEASSTTRSEIGVVGWSVHFEDSEALRVGYDASGRAIVEYTHTTTQSGNTERSEEYAVRQGDATCRLALAQKGDVVRVVEDSRTPQLRRVLDLLSADLKASNVASSASGGGGLLSQSSAGSVALQALTPQAARRPT